MIYIIDSGQSNAQCRAVGGRFPVNDRVKFWNNQSDVVGNLNLGDSFVALDRHNAPFTNSCNNIFAHAADHIARSTGLDVRVVQVAKGGTPFSEWDGKSSPMYERMISVLSAAGVSNADLFLWHQGEGDNAAGYSTYAARWSDFIQNLESDGVINSDTKIVIGELAPRSIENMHPVQHSLVNHRTDIAAIKTLPTSDGTHFDADGVIEAGEIYAKRTLLMMGVDFIPRTNETLGDYVGGDGDGNLSLINEVNTPIPIKCKVGDSRLISVDGAFVAPLDGDYLFNCTCYGNAHRMRLKLLNYDSSEIRTLAYSGKKDVINNNPILSGSYAMRMHEGQVVFLGINQSSGADITLTAGLVERYSNMTVIRLDN